MSGNFWDLFCSKMKVNWCDSFFSSLCVLSQEIQVFLGEFVQNFFSNEIEG